MNVEWFLAQLLARSVEVLPWLVGTIAGLGIVSFSPLGRGLIKHFRARQRDAAVTEQLLNELDELRKVLGEIAERLDYAEQRMSRDTRGVARPQAGPEMPQLPQPEKQVTPH